MAEQRGTVKSIAANEATITMDDGSTAVVAVPEVIAVEVGMPVTVVDTGDGKPIYMWGD